MGKTEDRLRELRLELPPPRAPIGKYVGAVRVGELLFLSGHGPIENGERVFIGKVGREFTIEQGQAAARLVVMGALRTAQDALGTLDNVVRVVKVLGFVNSAPGFNDQPSVIDGASELLLRVFEERGHHARSALGTSELPFNIAVEIEMILQVR